MGAVDTKLEFLADLDLYQTEQPFLILPGQPVPTEKISSLSNLVFEDRNVLIDDVRAEEDKFSVDTSGFQFITNHSDNLNFDDTSCMDKYREETATFLKKFFGASHVVSFDYVIRENKQYSGLEIDINDPSLIQTPPRGLHIDSTFESSPKIIQLNLSPDERKKYLKKGNRLQIINTWRPLVPQVEERPIAVCDFRSVNPNDLFSTARTFPHRTQHLYYLRYNETQKFYHLSKQTPDDLLVMVQYDTKGGGNARYCPHVSFFDPSCNHGRPPRKSIETRSIVIYEGGGRGG